MRPMPAPAGEPARFPWKWVVVSVVVVVGGLAVAQRVLWTRPSAQPTPAGSAPAEPSAKPSASSSAPLAPCPAGMARMPGGEQVDSFCIDLREVTVKEYAACQKSGKCTAPATAGNWGAVTPEEKLQRNASCNGGRADRAEHPINCVDFNQAEAYCEAQGKRLLTEAEWQWAAHGGGAKWKYPWGNEQPDIQLCWSAFTKRASTCVVGSYAKGANGWGVLDLEGNVREWVSTGAGSDRMLCGSDWTDRADNLATAGTCGQAPRTSKASFVGLRCAL
jgi:formylglycine-generating enzyme required for sulfatase activity